MICRELLVNHQFLSKAVTLYENSLKPTPRWILRRFALNGGCRSLRSAVRRREGVYRERKKATKIVTANTNTDKQRRPRKSAPVVPPPPPVPAYEPPKDLIPPNVLKHVPGRKVRSWKEPTSRAELNTMPVPYPFSEITDAPYNRGLDETPSETKRVIRHSKNR